MLIEPFADYLPRDFIFKVATTRDELAGYHALRRAVFCEEQHVFTGQDQDLIDAFAMPIICATLIAGMTDEVVGAVRIDERAPRLWYGSRLCVHAAYRKFPQLSPGVRVRNHLPIYRGFGALGAGLIYKAVSTAHAIGCDRFPADVQRPVRRCVIKACTKG